MRLARIFLFTLLPLFAEQITLEHMGRLVRLSNPQVSPGGRTIAVIVSRQNFEDNRHDGQLVLVDANTKATRTVVSDRRGISSPRWSASGTKLAFLAQVDAKPQIFILPMDGGDAKQITKAASGVQQFAWRPDEQEIAYVTEDEPTKGNGPERHNKSFEVGNNDFLVTTAPMPSHLWVANMDGKSRRLTSGTWTLPKSMPPSPPASSISWSADGKTITFAKAATAYTGDSDQSSIQVIDAATGTMRALTGRSKQESQPLFSPDGQSVTYWYSRGGESRNVNEIQVTSIAGGEGRSLTRAIDRNIMWSSWMPGGKSILVSANDSTGVGVWLQPLEGQARRLDLGKIVPTAAFWLEASIGAGGQIAFVGSEPQRPNELYFLPSHDAKPERLTDFNGALAKLDLGKTETVRWAGADGLQQDGVVTYPPGFDASKKYPLVLYIHGGPRSASKEVFGRPQLFAAQGWVVFEPNYRGSDNLGNAFQAAIYNDAGAGPGRDVISGLEYLKKRGWIDEQRMAVSGWSYGGYMTVWLLGNYPTLWRTAVAGAAVTDLMDQYNLGDSNVRRGSAWGGSPWTDPKRLQAAAEQSPITYATKIKTPTLIMSLTGDYRVTVTQSYKLYHVLRDNGIPTQFIAYPLSGHSPSDPVHSRDVDRRWIEWLTRYLKPAGQPSE